LVAMFMLAFASAFGQTKSSAPLDEGTIKSKFEYLINESERFKEFQVVNRRWVRKIRDHVADSLSTVRAELEQKKNTISTQQKEVDALKAELDGTNENLITVTNDRDSIKFFGVNVGKNTYKSIMWGIVACLALLSAVLFLSFKRSHNVTSNTQIALKRTQDEFDSFRERTLKKEQKIMRRLQDELNKNAT